MVGVALMWVAIVAAGGLAYLPWPAASPGPHPVTYRVVGVAINGPAVTAGSGFTEIAEATSGENTLLEAARGVKLPNVSASWTTAKNAGLLAREIKAGALQDTTRPPVPKQLWGTAQLPTVGITR